MRRKGFGLPLVIGSLAALLVAIGIGIGAGTIAQNRLNREPSPVPITIQTNTPTPLQAEESTQTTIPSDWKTYTNTKNGFNYTFKYPNDWVINFDPNSIEGDIPNEGFNITYNTLVLASSPVESDVIGYSLFYEQNGTLIYFFKPSEETFSIDDYPEEYKSSKINDYSAKWVDKAGAAVGEGVTEYSLFHKDKFMLITRNYKKGAKSPHEDTFQKILSTFEFTD